MATKDEYEVARLSLKAELSDAIISLPGGVGTWEEFFEALAWNQLGIYSKPIILFDVDGYYSKLFEFTQFSVEEGFLPETTQEELLISDSLNEIFKFINSDVINLSVQASKILNNKINLIALDTRYHRSSLDQEDKPYYPTTDETKTMLGKDQWKWLEEIVKIEKKEASEEKIFELAIDSGAYECISYDGYHEIHTNSNEIYEKMAKLKSKIFTFRLHQNWTFQRKCPYH